jgi:hypothetical protein
MKRLSLNDLGPFDLHPAGCRRLALMALLYARFGKC